METNDVAFAYIADLLKQRTGQQLTENRKWRVNTALSGIFREHGLSNIDQLVCLLDCSEGKGLEQQVVDALLNNETYFFRDPAYFDFLARNVLPRLAALRAPERRLTIWSAGCSTGQEVFSLAMLFAENPQTWDGWSIEILGTDISHRAIDAARLGSFSQFEIQRGLSIARMLNHFEESERGWVSNDSLARLVRFNRHNILEQPPTAAPFDLILCRNVMLYFDSAMRERAFERLFQALKPDGRLMLGAGETALGNPSRFTPEIGMTGIFAPGEGARPALPSEFGNANTFEFAAKINALPFGR